MNTSRRNDNPVVEFPFSTIRHGRSDDGPLCHTRSRWTPFLSRGTITCLKCLGILAQRPRAAGDGLVECSVCGNHVGITEDQRVQAHRQATRRKAWCSGYDADATTLRQIPAAEKGR